MSASSTTPPVPASADDFPARAALAFILGLHGLIFVLIFPLGPQIARLWSPGVAGFAALCAALPFAAVIAGLLARRSVVLPGRARTLALLATAAALPAVVAKDYTGLFVARLMAGVVIGVSLAAIQRRLPVAAPARVARIPPRVVAFGLPLAILAATSLDYRAAFAMVVAAGLGAALFTPAETLPDSRPVTREPAPAGLLASAALSFVAASYLTVVSGFLVFNSGHTEWHIVVVLGLAAALSFTVLPAIKLARRLVHAPVEYELTLAFSALTLCSLLAINHPFPAAGAVVLIALFLTANTARHIALTGLVVPRLDPEHVPAHQANTQLANYLGSGLGSFCTGLVVHAESGRGLVGMPALLACALTATALAALCPRFLPRLK